jgi:hypothetical protein
MKKTIILLVAIAVIMITACGKQDKTEIITKQIVYDVVINNQKVICEEGSEDASWSWFFNNIEASARCQFLENLFEKVISDTLNKDTLKITDDDGIKLAVDQYNQRLIVYDSVKYYPPYLVCDTLIASVIGPKDVYILRFKEKWTYDPATMQISKKVLAYAPLYFPNDPARPGKRVSKPVPLFWMQQDTNAECNSLFTDKILYSVAFNDPPALVNPDSANCAEYVNDLLQYVCKDSIPANIWDNWSKTDLRGHDNIWKAEVLPKRNQKTIDSVVPGIYWQVFYGLENIDKTDTLYPDAVRAGLHFSQPEGICFVEEWYLNPVSLQLAKKVEMVGAVAAKRNYRGDIKAWIPSFVVKFNRIGAPPKVKKAKKAEENK